MALVIDSCVIEPAQLEPLVTIATTTLTEQVASTEEFTIIRSVSLVGGGMAVVCSTRH